MNYIKSFIKEYPARAAIIGSMVFLFIMSVCVFMGKSLRLDEAQSLFQTNGSFLGTINIIAKDIHLPVYFLSLRAWNIFFGASLFSIRFFSLIFLLLTIPVLYTFAKEAYNRTTGILVVLMAALSPVLNWFGSEARMYTMLLLVTTLNQLMFLRIWSAKVDPSKKKYAWPLYALTVWVGLYTHYFFALILVAQALFYFTNLKLFSKGTFKKLVGIAAVGGILLGAWFYIRTLVGLNNNAAPMLAAPTSIDIFNVFSNFIIGFQTTTVNTFFLSMWPLSLIACFALLTKRHKILPETKYLLLSLCVPIALAFIVSVTVRPIFLSRYLIVTLPALYLLTLHLVSLYPKKVYHSCVIGIFLILSVSLSFEAFSSSIPVNEDFRAAAEYLDTHATVSDLIVVSAPFLTYPMEYYYKGNVKFTTFPVWNRYENREVIPEFSEPYMIETFTGWAENYSKLFILMGYDQGYEDETKLYLDTHYERLDVKTFSPGLNLYIYKLKYI